jgi:predicted phage terminase large subunit-like protein
MEYFPPLSEDPELAQKIVLHEEPLIQPVTEEDLLYALDPRSPEFANSVRLTPATLAHFRTKGKWIPADHLLYISSEIAAELSMGDARIIVEVPPRHGKSELISINTPIWFLDKYPFLNIILTTYSADLSVRFGRRVRDSFLEDDGRFLRAKIRPDAQRTDVFLTTEGGGMMSVGIGGAITGFGANLLLVDDYVKNFAEAMSENVNNSTWNWFTTTAYTRLEPGASVIVLATRWAVNDLIGKLQEQTDEPWRVIRMPALSEGPLTDLLHRPFEEALWPMRYNSERLKKIRSLLGDYLFDALYQQDPKNPEDMKTDPEQIRIVDDIPEPFKLRWVRSWDLAATEKKKGDFTAGMLMGSDVRRNSLLATTYLGDLVRGQWGASKVEEMLLQTAEEDGPGVPIVIEQEPGASGKSYAEYLANSVLKNYTVKIQPSGSTNKVVRAQPYIASVSKGRICMLKAPWNGVVKRELKEFGKQGRKDDTVDAASMGYNEIHQTKVLSATWGRSSTIQALANKRPLTRRGPGTSRSATFGR